MGLGEQIPDRSVRARDGLAESYRRELNACALVDTLARLDALGRVRVAVDQPTSHELLWAADRIAWSCSTGGGNPKNASRIWLPSNVT